MISLLVAMDRNNNIGYRNSLPWHLPNDLKFFKEKTTGHTIIMGRKTYDSIGKALPNRKNIVITRKDIDFPEGIEVIDNLDILKQWNDENNAEEYFVIGGGEIFTQVLPFADRLYITMIDDTFPADTYFPLFSKDDWSLSINRPGEKDEKNPYDYAFLQYDRK